jgi:hypothetical protein
MQLEELQAIWETQTERPVFSINDFGLHLALYHDDSSGEPTSPASSVRCWGS